ncbi:Glycosyltransferase involved in cell wall bisynthesis [Lachnospiraceae bacterium KH1T2]|nr:Glycosyltransferase involved in cell wall bisynthesis [Lachnospiraceae bacterium KH1T2]
MEIRNDVKISVIVPVYNGEKTIERCLDSILAQTIDRCEIICVDDGSNDSTVEIIDRYIKEHEISIVILLRQKHGGAGCARNYGIKNAHGKYVAFIDADDCFYDADALEKMYNVCILNNVFICGSKVKIVNKNVTRDAEFCKENELRYNIKLNYADYQMDYGFISYIYDRGFLLDNGIEFPIYRRYEDPVFLVKAMSAAKTFSVADTTLYCINESDYHGKFDGIVVIDLLRAILENLIFSMKNGYDILFNRTMKRLNYEYAYIILNSLDFNQFAQNEIIMGFLLRINEVDREYCGKSDHLIRLLKQVAKRAATGTKLYQYDLKERIKDEGRIAIYGAGLYGQGFLNFLASNGFKEKVVCFCDKNAEKINLIDDVRVFSIKQVKEMNCKIYVAVGECYQEEVEESLKNNGIYEFEMLDGMFLYRVSSYGNKNHF